MFYASYFRMVFKCQWKKSNQLIDIFLCFKVKTRHFLMIISGRLITFLLIYPVRPATCLSHLASFSTYLICSLNCIKTFFVIKAKLFSWKRNSFHKAIFLKIMQLFGHFYLSSYIMNRYDKSGSLLSWNNPTFFNTYKQEQHHDTLSSFHWLFRK